MTYRVKYPVVEAVKLTAKVAAALVKEGDDTVGESWLVTFPTGDQKIIPDEEFQITYEPDNVYEDPKRDPDDPWIDTDDSEDED